MKKENAHSVITGHSRVEQIRNPKSEIGNHAQSGFVLVTVVVLMALLAAIGLLLLLVSSRDIKVSANLYWGKQSFYAADAGVNMAVRNVEDYVFGGTETLSPVDSVRVDPGSSSNTATYSYQVAKRTSGSLRPRAGYEVGSWVGAGFDVSATGQAGMAQSRMEVLSRATVPADSYAGGK